MVACYLGSWAVYRPSHGKFSVEDIDPTLCTHVVYAFAGMDETTYEMIPLDRNYDIDQNGYARAVALKQRNPRLKVTIAVGGWNEGSIKYSKMAKSSRTRALFINSVVAFISKHKFDGLDLDWEYPANYGGKPDDKKNFVSLCQELRRAFRRDWVLTAAVGAGQNTVETAYDLQALARELDYLHLMAYDYHGNWEKVTGHNAPLYSRDDESGPERRLNVAYSVNYYLRNGVPPQKLVLGLAMYGRTFRLQHSSNHGIGAPVQKTAFAGDYTPCEDGFLGYNEICEKQVSERGLWKVVRHEAHQAPYMYRDDKWVSYDDADSIKRKVAFARSCELAGVMVWSIDTDDFQGRAGAGRYPLLTAINRALQ